MEGFLYIHKPVGITSFICIRRIRRILASRIAVGHAGTLDPMANGVIILAIGRGATKRLDNFSSYYKEYTAIGTLGELTDTLDKEGAVIKTGQQGATREQLEAAMASFGSGYEQIPPIYSALKHEGIPLHRYARKGTMAGDQLEQVAFEKKKNVQLYELELTDYNEREFAIRARVSHGTYIRSLMNDIATRAGSCATTTQLVRTAIGSITLDKTILLDDICTVEDIERHLVGVDLII